MLRSSAGRIALLAIALLVSRGASFGAEPGLRIVASKKHHVLKVIRDGKTLRTFRASFGYSEGQKESIGDGRTPVGRYFVYERKPSDRFRWFLGISYPGIEDADRAFEKGRISADTWADIFIAERSRQAPPYDTPLGGFIGIHGTGAEGRKAKLRQISDWTDGCVALNDSDMDELFAMTPVGTVVEIEE